MRLVGWVLAALPMCLALRPSPAKLNHIVIGGDVNGYLSPCGCTSPMLGGIQRWSAAAAKIAPSPDDLILYNGGFVSGNGRQDELKAETLAEALRQSKVDAVGIAPQDARLGPGMIESIQRLTGNKLSVANIAPPSGLNWPAERMIGDFRVLSLMAETGTATKDLGARERDVNWQSKKPTIVLFSGDLESAKALALSHPLITLIAYSSSTEATTSPIKVGHTWLVSPGEHGKSILNLTWNGKQLVQCSAIPLAPTANEISPVDGIYQTYLRRVSSEKLLEQVPRLSTTTYAGSAKCQSCHQNAYDTWKHSGHARALMTLTTHGHDRDPDCVSCHVVGLSSTGGYRDMTKTPDLANVGCESCHGSGTQHMLAPKKGDFPKFDADLCISCHNPTNSPRYNFSTYWPRIKH